jgi:hypothetical protein
MWCDLIAVQEYNAVVAEWRMLIPLAVAVAVAGVVFVEGASRKSHVG